MGKTIEAIRSRKLFYAFLLSKEKGVITQCTKTLIFALNYCIMEGQSFRDKIFDPFGAILDRMSCYVT